MTLLQVWEALSIGKVSPEITSDTLIGLTIFGGFFIAIQLASALFHDCTSSREENHPRNILLTIYGLPYFLVMLLVSSFEFLVLIQFSFNLTALVLASIILLIFIIIKGGIALDSTSEKAYSTFGLVYAIQEFAIDKVVRPGRVSFISQWVNRMLVIYKIHKQQINYIKRYGN